MQSGMHQITNKGQGKPDTEILDLINLLIF